MAFKNEKISEQDREWVSKLVNYESIRAVSRWIHEFRLCLWTADRERNAYLIDLGGGGSPDDVGRLPYAVLVLNGEVIVFNLAKVREGTFQSGLHYEYGVQNLSIPSSLEDRKEEIYSLIEQALQENTYLNPTADGGTYANPNVTARKNILSCTVTFE